MHSLAPSLSLYPAPPEREGTIPPEISLKQLSAIWHRISSRHLYHGQEADESRTAQSKIESDARQSRKIADNATRHNLKKV